MPSGAQALWPTFVSLKAESRWRLRRAWKQLRALENGMVIQVIETKISFASGSIRPQIWRASKRPCVNKPGLTSTATQSKIEAPKEMKYIFVTGGVVSSLGKGLTAAALGTLAGTSRAQGRPAKISIPTSMSIRGTMSPYQHGEVYVLEDGAETDLDLGHYERFTSGKLTPQEQPHHRPDLRGGAGQGAARRLPRQDGPGHSPRYRRDQAAHKAGRPVPGLRRGHHRNRRAPRATSRACRSLRPSGNLRWKSAMTTRSSFTSP